MKKNTVKKDEVSTVAYDATEAADVVTKIESLSIVRGWSDSETKWDLFSAGLYSDPKSGPTIREKKSATRKTRYNREMREFRNLLKEITRLETVALSGRYRVKRDKSVATSGSFDVKGAIGSKVLASRAKREQFLGSMRFDTIVELIELDESDILDERHISASDLGFIRRRIKDNWKGVEKSKGIPLVSWSGDREDGETPRGQTVRILRACLEHDAKIKSRQDSENLTDGKVTVETPKAKRKVATKRKAA